MGFSIYAVFFAAWLLPLSPRWLLGFGLLIAALICAYYDLAPRLADQYSLG